MGSQIRSTGLPCSWLIASNTEYKVKFCLVCSSSVPVTPVPLTAGSSLSIGKRKVHLPEYSKAQSVDHMLRMTGHKTQLT